MTSTQWLGVCILLTPAVVLVAIFFADRERAAWAWGLLKYVLAAIAFVAWIVVSGLLVAGALP